MRKRRPSGYTTLKLFTAYSFEAGRGTHTITARLDNATNELYRNHLSLIKDFVPGDGPEHEAALLGAFLA